MGTLKTIYYHREIWWVLLMVIQQIFAVELRNMIAVNTLPDGEIETRIVYKKIRAKETTIGKGYNHGLKYRQILQGKNLLQLIYDENNALTDCEFVNDEKISKTFLNNFKRDLNNLLATSNVSLINMRHKNNNSMLEHFDKGWFDLRKLKKDCERLHSFLRKEALRLRDTNNYNNNQTSRRGRRDLGDFLRVPGTKWCGKGYSADKYTRLGMFSRTDRCCRKHDTTCPFWIGGFSTKYGLYNWRVNTIMHCGCDERFRGCLKLVGSSDANMVGKLFFNIVQTQCFILKYKKKCIKRSWWGKCEKHKLIKYAIMRENLPY